MIVVAYIALFGCIGYCAYLLIDYANQVDDHHRDEEWR